MNIYIFLISVTISIFSFASTKPEKLDWNGIEVSWIEDDSVPTYSVQVYFSDGALSDARSKGGETSLMFSSLSAGTNRFTQKEIKDNLEYYGISYGSTVFHEYSTFSFSGLNKDLLQVTKKICHMFADSIFPKNEIRASKRRILSGFQNLVTNHSELADRALRKLTLRSTEFEIPMEGTVKTIKRIKSSDLKRKLTYFNNQVKKRIYIRGSKEVLNIKNILKDECKWSGDQNFARESNKKLNPKLPKTKIVLIPVKKANQAQIRFGRTLSLQEIENPDLLTMSASYLGGGFPSELVQEIRVKRGLSYFVRTYSQGQKYYGRSILSTFSRNEKVNETIQVAKDVIEKIGKGEVNEEKLKTMKNFLSGAHLFQFESNDSFLRNLMSYDHKGRDIEELYNFPKAIQSYSKEQISETIKNNFGWDDIVIVVVGSKSLLKSLKKMGSAQIVNADFFL